MPETLKAQALAERVAAAITEGEATARVLGIRVDEVRPGYARLSMTVTADMLNAVGTCHGGMSFTLADTAFAYACNSHNRMTVGQNCTISYLAPAREGDRLTAECREVHQKGRSGIYDCAVTRQDGEAVALFRGQSRTIQGHYVEGNE